MILYDIKTFLSKLRPISKLCRNRTIKMVSKNYMSDIIILSPSKGTILNNKTEFFHKNVFFYVSLRTFQSNYTVLLKFLPVVNIQNGGWIQDGVENAFTFHCMCFWKHDKDVILEVCCLWEKVLNLEKGVTKWIVYKKFRKVVEMSLNKIKRLKNLFKVKTILCFYFFKRWPTGVFEKIDKISFKNDDI
jgi:hypothetical protein